MFYSQHHAVPVNLVKTTFETGSNQLPKLKLSNEGDDVLVDWALVTTAMIFRWRPWRDDHTDPRIELTGTPGDSIPQLAEAFSDLP